jgi:putative DNA primase/helicase
MIDIHEQCAGRWRSLLPMFGIDAKFLTGKQTPCPMCGGKDRFRFDNKEGRGTYFCNNCGAGNGVELVILKTGMQFRDAAKAIRYKIGAAPVEKARPAMTTDARLDSLRQMWRASKIIAPDDDAGRYLRSRNLEPIADSLRFLPRCRVTGEGVKELAAMIALVRSPDGEPLTLHRTYLQDGAKAAISSPRRMMAGETPIGSYIQLGPVSDCLGISEGIETALAVKRDYGVTCWSAISDSGLAAFNPPESVRELRIYADNDRNYAGQAAAYSLAKRLSLSQRTINVSVHIPATAGTDFAD